MPKPSAYDTFLKVIAQHLPPDKPRREKPDPNAAYYWCGADVTFDREGNRYVCGGFGPFATEREAVLENARIHPSFGYFIYKTATTEKRGLKRAYGLRAGNACSGYLILERMPDAYEHPDFEAARAAFEAEIEARRLTYVHPELHY